MTLALPRAAPTPAAAQLVTRPCPAPSSTRTGSSTARPCQPPAAPTPAAAQCALALPPAAPTTSASVRFSGTRHTRRASARRRRLAGLQGGRRAGRPSGAARVADGAEQMRLDEVGLRWGWGALRRTRLAASAHAVAARAAGLSRSGKEVALGTGCTGELSSGILGCSSTHAGRSSASPAHAPSSCSTGHSSSATNWPRVRVGSLRGPRPRHSSST